MESREIIKKTGTTLDLVLSDVLDHYRTFSLLEKLLHNPLKLAEQLSFQIEPQTQQLLIEKLVYCYFQRCNYKNNLLKKKTFFTRSKKVILVAYKRLFI